MTRAHRGDAVGSGRRRHRALPRVAAAAGTVLAALLALLGSTAPAARADGVDPTTVATLSGVTPALPPEVVVQVRSSVAPQMVVADPTPVPLTLLDPAGVPFVRISATGVEGNVTSPFFHVSLNPPDAPPARLPPDAVPNAPVRWAPVSATPEWGWFDPRLQPDVSGAARPGGQDAAPNPEDPAQQRVTVLARWSIPMVYGATPVTASGEVQHRPVVGRFDTTVDPVTTPGLTATPVPGSVPAMYLQNPAGHTVEILGASGRPWLRAGPTGTDADADSPEYRADRAGRGEDAPLGTGWTHLSDDGSSLTWLDPRLGYPSPVPPPSALAAGGPTDLGRWTVPLRVDGTPGALTGSVRWLPTAAVLDQQGQDDPWATRPWVTVALVAGGVVLVGALLLLARRARRATRGTDTTDPRTTDTDTDTVLEEHR